MLYEPAVPFETFDKIPRLFRTCVITEKIDGTNAQIYIGEDGSFLAGSRNRWLAPTKGADNHGFATWASEHRDELMELGPGRHYGEWWGQGIQRRYDLKEKRFSLFNVHKWKDERPSCCDVVPVLYEGPFDTHSVILTIAQLRRNGSIAAPGFMNPEGVVVYHKAAGKLFKATVENDEIPKAMSAIA